MSTNTLLDFVEGSENEFNRLAEEECVAKVICKVKWRAFMPRMESLMNQSDPNVATSYEKANPLPVGAKERRGGEGIFAL